MLSRCKMQLFHDSHVRSCDSNMKSYDSHVRSCDSHVTFNNYILKTASEIYSSELYKRCQNVSTCTNDHSHSVLPGDIR